jgi:hypothetical protein
MSEGTQTLTVVIPPRVKLPDGRKTMITNGVMAVEAREDITLIKAAARAFRCRGMLEAGAFATINQQDQFLTVLPHAVADAVGAGNKKGDPEKTAVGRTDTVGAVERTAGGPRGAQLSQMPNYRPNHAANALPIQSA